MILSAQLRATVVFKEGLPLGSSGEYWAIGESLTQLIAIIYDIFAD